MKGTRKKGRMGSGFAYEMMDMGAPSMGREQPS